MIRDLNTERQGSHLSAEELGELLGSDSAIAASPAHEHVRACAECAVELASLREALALFRETSTAYASEQLAGVQRPSSVRAPVHSAFSPGLLWAAAGLVVAAGMVPLEVQHQHRQNTTSATTTHSPAVKPLSDEALLDAVNVELSASVPAAMQPLADPSGTMNPTTETQPSTTRKN
ncbi:MAG: hypothetical protein NVSMB62_29500 [Acidobacteriaceae bacterium]